ncbi:MAG: dTDP-4-dehydrorhamnose 3,5-epimerase [Planctomycetes bacterium]|nr:dTDP-4-dehydrorhamnose 3,5-epimerase [Planctomycetota bacterium]
MQVLRLELPGLLLVSPTVHRDGRGFFVERFHLERFREHGVPTQFAQDNHSRSAPRVLRGLHYQWRPAQGKLVGVVRGRIWDVVVDLRPDSLTFGRSLGTELSDATAQQLWIPAGFAHGFCILGDEAADVIYKVDVPYAPGGEGGIHWADPDLGIDWPIADPVVSARDQALGRLADYRASPPAWEF